jgi:hypothetical protein
MQNNIAVETTKSTVKAIMVAGNSGASRVDDGDAVGEEEIGVAVGVGDGVCTKGIVVRPDRITASENTITITNTKTKIRIVFTSFFTIFLLA